MSSDEFVLEGTLLRVLQLSRLLGTAPLHFKPNGQSTTASVSYPWFVYSCSAATVLNMLSYLLNYLLKVLEPLFSQTDDVIKSQLFMSLGISQNILLTLRVFLGSFTGFKRMKSLVIQINGLQMVFQEFKKKSTAADRQNKVLILVIILIILSNLIRIVCVAEHEVDIYLKASGIGVDIVVFCQLIMSVLQEFKVVLINMKVAEALNMLKIHLRQLLRDDKRLTAQQEIRRVGQSYLKLYEVVSQNYKHEGGIIFLTFASIVASLVISGFVFADDLNNLKKSHLSFDTLMIAVPSIASIHRIIIFISSSHQIHKEVCEINMVVSELVYTTAVGCEVPVELDTLIKQLQLTRPVFSVLGIFTVKQSTLTTIFSAWVTYTVILIQVRSKQSPH